MSTPRLILRESGPSAGWYVCSGCGAEIETDRDSLDDAFADHLNAHHQGAHSMPDPVIIYQTPLAGTPISFGVIDSFNPEGAPARSIVIANDGTPVLSFELELFAELARRAPAVADIARQVPLSPAVAPEPAEDLPEKAPAAK